LQTSLPNHCRRHSSLSFVLLSSVGNHLTSAEGVWDLSCLRHHISFGSGWRQPLKYLLWQFAFASKLIFFARVRISRFPVPNDYCLFVIAPLCNHIVRANPVVTNDDRYMYGSLLQRELPVTTHHFCTKIIILVSQLLSTE
jgi:hypothetical protein